MGQPHFPPFSCSQINASCLCGFETAMLQEKVFHPIGKAMIINFSTPKGGSVKMTALLTAANLSKSTARIAIVDTDSMKGLSARFGAGWPTAEWRAPMVIGSACGKLIRQSGNRSVRDMAAGSRFGQ